MPRVLARVLACVLAVLLLTAGTARAADRRAGAPGSLTGYAFDTCAAPSQDVMDAWWEESPYAAVGVYIGGSNRFCAQPELTARWVATQQKRGWHVLAVQVGPQASCSGYDHVMSTDQPTAEKQGRKEATKAVSNAKALGLGRGSTVFYDLEDYDIGPDACRRAALSFLSGWTKGLHAKGYVSGVYSNVAAAIRSLDFADRVSPGSYAMPDDIWFAWANGRADTRGDSQMRSHTWDGHHRVHQYRLDVQETYGGGTLTVDASWVDVGRGSVSPSSRPLCNGVDVDLRTYPALKTGRRGAAVEAVQCLLRHHGFSRTAVTGSYDAKTAAAVTRAQKKLSLKQTGKVDRHTWVALLARGTAPLLKVGSAGEPVFRLERALTAALGKPVVIEGVVTRRTEKAVRKYQAEAGLPKTGVVTDEVWDLLQAGR